MPKALSIFKSKWTDSQGVSVIEYCVVGLGVIGVLVIAFQDIGMRLFTLISHAFA